MVDHVSDFLEWNRHPGSVFSSFRGPAWTLRQAGVGLSAIVYPIAVGLRSNLMTRSAPVEHTFHVPEENLNHSGHQWKVEVWIPKLLVEQG